MIKIVYAARNSYGARFQLARFLSAIENTPYLVKVSAYQKSSPQGVSIDWNLDCLHDIFKPEQIYIKNDNLSIYFDQVKTFKPDLVISDLEYFTSHVAQELNIPVWQCSSSLLSYALPHSYKYDLGIFSKHAFVSLKNASISQRLLNAIDNSDRKLVYSHFGDAEFMPILLPNFEWVRPYFKLGKDSILCQHNVVCSLIQNNRKIFKLLNKINDCVVFTQFTEEKYRNFLLKELEDQIEYYCNLKNCRLNINEGQTVFLADAFYNGKFSLIFPEIRDLECLNNYSISDKLGLSKTIFEDLSSLEEYYDLSVKIFYNNQIQFLHEKLKEL